MTVSAVAGAGWLSATHQLVETTQGRLVHAPLGWEFWLFVIGFVVGLYLYLATYHEYLWMPGRREAKDPHISLAWNKERGGDRSPPEGAYKNHTMLFVTVENSGPTSQFSTRFENVRGFRRFPFPKDDGLVLDLESYFGDVAWEDTAQRQQVIGYTGKARLFLLSSFTEPRALWFLVPTSISYAEASDKQLKGWTLQAVDSSVEFDLFVVNETRMKQIRRRIRVNLAEDGSIESCEIGDRTARRSREYTSRVKVPSTPPRKGSRAPTSVR